MLVINKKDSVDTVAPTTIIMLATVWRKRLTLGFANNIPTPTKISNAGRANAKNITTARPVLALEAVDMREAALFTISMRFCAISGSCTLRNCKLATQATVSKNSAKSSEYTAAII